MSRSPASSPDTQEKGKGRRSLRQRLSLPVGYISLVLAIVGAVSFVGGGILYLLIKEIRTFSLAVVIVGIVLLLMALLLSRKQVVTALVGRRGRYGINTAVMVVAMLAIAGLLNFLFFDLISWRADVTATRQFSLSPQTIKVLDTLKEPIQARAFFVLTQPDQQQTWGAVSDLLDEFKKRSDRKFDYELLDPQEQPAIARQFNVSTPGTIVFEAKESGRRSPVVTSLESPSLEGEFTSAILVVTGEKQKKVYFLEGHDERSILESGDKGYSIAARGLFSDNYQVESLNLLKTPDVPQDAAALVVAGPKKDLLENEKAALEQYLVGGGRAIFLLESDAPQSFTSLAKDWAVVLGKGFIVDVDSSLATDPRTPLIPSPQYLPTPITQVLESPSLFPGVTSVEPALPADEMPDGIQVLPLAFTSFDSWLETDKEVNKFDEKVDTRGPLFVAAAVMADHPLKEGARRSAKTTRLVVFGDSDFASNFFVAYNSNGDLFLNSVNWLTEDVQLISIRPKPLALRQMFLTQRERDFIKWSSWILIPGVVIMLGVVTWWRRR